MNGVINQLVFSLTGKEDIWECTTEELQQLVNQYPYFGVANFLLAKKHETEASSVSIDYDSKAALFFQQPLWLDHLVHDTGTKLPEMKQLEPIEKIPETPVAIESHQNNLPEEIVVEDVQELIASSNHHSSENHWQSNLQGEETEVIEPPVPAIGYEIVGEVTPVDEGIITNGYSGQSDIQKEIEEKQVVSIAFESSEEETSSSYDEEDAPLPYSGNEPELKLPEFKIEAIDPSKAKLSFEPYHTIDYFASQGIKFKEEDKSKDKLTKQLKSFTEWLKVMKKLPESEIQSSVSATDEHRVSIMAQVSLSDREVVTESMAEVWELQGNRGKAAQIYQKLSLLDPAKSAYFAAKIDQLKRL